MSASQIPVDSTLDCKGLACPMPIVKTKKAIDNLNAGQIIEIQATDQGSVADMQSWTRKTGHQYLGLVEEAGLLKHYIRKASPDEMKEDKMYPNTASHEELSRNLGEPGLTVLDVREPAEFAFSHIPGALSMPLGELKARYNELDQEHKIYVVCRTGSRSDLACQQLEEFGFDHVWNVTPGMTKWQGTTEKTV
ncbi:sulfurtransferase TusA family protein [Paenibacillus tuaregi]|uniref:sulfurtransferase TusA family protein n=1 Tax=Paenibacillus tuaregi TaxID=1816681 RepID=UPI000837CA50|nr:sulfurtransferase TusA family protein [Paenibacillus tuaregi]